MQRIIIYDERTAIVLGIFTLFELLAVFFSCRTCVTIPKRMKLVNLMNIGVYRKFYRYHSYYWWVFQVLLASHFLMVVMQIGMQKTGIIDFPTFLAVMILGLGAAITALTLLVSCRIMPRLITAATSKKPMDSARFRMFSMRHDYYWGIVWLLALAHFTVSYIHIGVWPR
jgi:hypothetical protein